MFVFLYLLTPLCIDPGYQAYSKLRISQLARQDLGDSNLSKENQEESLFGYPFDVRVIVTSKCSRGFCGANAHPIAKVWGKLFVCRNLAIRFHITVISPRTSPEFQGILDIPCHQGKME